MWKDMEMQIRKSSKMLNNDTTSSSDTLLTTRHIEINNAITCSNKMLHLIIWCLTVDPEESIINISNGMDEVIIDISITLRFLLITYLLNERMLHMQKIISVRVICSGSNTVSVVGCIV